jgi:hypothetical protein
MEDECLLPFSAYIVSYAFVGSRETCEPAPTDTDLDILVLTDNCKEVLGISNKLNYKYDGSEIIDEDGNSEENVFCSLKKDHINIIVTEDKSFFDKFILASSIAKQLNLLVKQDRIILFQAILYGNTFNDNIDIMKGNAKEKKNETN